MSGDRETIFVDVTELVTFELRTGIQRVVRELVHHGLNRAVPDLEIVPVIALGERFHRVNAAGLANMEGPGKGSGASRITHELGVPLWIRLAKRGLTLNARLYTYLQRHYVGWTMLRRLRRLTSDRPERIEAGMKLVLLDSFWGGSSVVAAAERAAGLGTEIILVGYDLIPLTHPQYCDQILVQKFRDLLDRIMPIATRVLAISEFCADAYRARYPAAAVMSFPLGHDVRPIVGGAAVDSNWPDGLWDGSGLVHLIVGSIEPRKGHEVVLDAFERRWAAGASDKLLIIGKIGWKVDQLMARIDGHHLAGAQLFAVHDANDAMLADALHRADTAIIASYVEGFGLPLAEAMAAGLPVIASDIPVFREIAGGLARYFEAGSSTALAEVVAAVPQQLADMQADARRFAWPDWDEAARIFFQAVSRRPAAHGMDTP